MRLPEGYEPVETRSAVGFALGEVRPWVEDALEADTLHGRAAREAEETLHGRGPVHVVAVAGRRRTVRHYFRGGAVAGMLDDRYLRLGEPRPLRELRASVAARERGVPTPRIVAGAVYPAGIFYRADLLTDYVSDSRDLAAVLFGGAGPGERRSALAAAGRLVARMAAAGLRHPDLNARNVLLTPSEGGFRALLLDLDRCTVAPPGRSVSATAPLTRLRRSLHKLSKARRGEAPSPAELSLLEEAAGGEGAP